MSIFMKVTLTMLSFMAALTLFLPQWMISPGATIAAHHEISSDCFSCHTPFLGSPSEKCMECHRIDEIGIKSTQGEAIQKEDSQIDFHQELITADCVACHSDHQGVKPFRTANRFSHHLLNPSIQQRCSNCHATPMDQVHAKTKKNCSACHTEDSWLSAHFDHQEYFRFDRYHDAECSVCHESSDYSQYTCYGCHEHSEWNVRGEHLEEGINDYEVCVECHRSGDEDEAEWLWRQKRLQKRGSDGGQPYRYYGYEDEDEDEDDD